MDDSALDSELIDRARESFETNFYGMVRVSQDFAPILLDNDGGANINVLSHATWFAQPPITGYAASKSAAWSFTNALRVDMLEKGTQVLALHVGFLDTNMSKDVDIEKSDPQQVAARTLDGLENGDEEVLADEQAKVVKGSLSTEQAYYLNPREVVF